MRTGKGEPGDADRRRRLVLYAVAASGLLALAAVVAAMALARSDGGGSAEGLAGTMQAAGCTLKHYPALERSHINDLNAMPKYNSFPPTSGPHFGVPAVWSIYSEPVGQLQLVHNLEHGGVIIQYGSRVPDSSVDRLREFYQDDPQGLIVAPLPRLGDKIALAAWTDPEGRAKAESRWGQGHLATCTSFDDDAFTAFRDAYRGKGPEPIPLEALTPGST